MRFEYDALVTNWTWTLVPRPPGANIITDKWVFRHRFLPDGPLDRYKARWVVRGFAQCAGVDFSETFSLVVKPATIRVVLQLAASRHWPVHQLDINNAFLYGHLQERVLCQQPTGFVDPTRPDDVCLLSRSLYGLKQAPRAWYHRIAAFLTTLGFRNTTSDTSLFVLHRADHVAMLLLYVDDIVITASRADILRDIIGHLGSEFRLKDLGALHFFLGINVRRDASGFFLHQGQYALDLLDRAGMTD